MITVGLLLSLDSSFDDSTTPLRSHPMLTVGERSDRWLPLAVEARDDAECREYHDWIAAQPGVAFVDVVHVNFEPADADGTPDETADAPPLATNSTL